MEPLWIETERRSYPEMRADISVDVAIVGAGFSGIGAAFGLRDWGLKVAVLEERTVSSGASGRNGGFILAGPAMPFAEAVDALGTEIAREIWDFTVENNRLIAELIEEHGIDCGYLRRGSMSLAASEDEVADLRATARALSDAGIAACMVGASDLPRPLDRHYFAGLYYPGNAEMNPGRFNRAMAGTLASRISFYEATPVSSMKRRDCWILVCPGGTVRAQTVILATNAWTERLLPNVPISPRRGQVISTPALPSVVVPFPMYADHGYQYWRQTAEGFLVVGGWRNLDLEAEATNREELNPEIGHALERFCRTVGGPEAAIERRWAGIMGFTPDMLPLVGAVPVEEGLWLAAGYSGHGAAMALSCGARIAERALGGQAFVPEVFDPDRMSLKTGIEPSRLFEPA